MSLAAPRICSSLTLGRLVICFYDHIFTFSQEVTYVWNRRFSAITVVFVLNRYVVMSDRIVRLFQFKSWDGVSAADANRVRISALRVSSRFS